jgi:hypothetical protein
LVGGILTGTSAANKPNRDRDPLAAAVTTPPIRQFTPRSYPGSLDRALAPRVQRSRFSFQAGGKMLEENKVKIAYTVVERNKDGRKFWVRVGAAFVNRDGSLNVRLDAMPVNGELQIRDYQPREAREGASHDQAA